MREILKEIIDGIPERARYGICFGLGFCLCGIIGLVKFFAY